jgi:hypothetical protein
VPVPVRQQALPAQQAAPGTGSWANIARSGLSPPGLSPGVVGEWHCRSHAPSMCLE